jgi:hypothetical protein
VDIEKDKAARSAQQEMEGLRVGVDIAKSKEKSLIERVKSVQPKGGR